MKETKLEQGVWLDADSVLSDFGKYEERVLSGQDPRRARHDTQKEQLLHPERFRTLPVFSRKDRKKLLDQMDKEDKLNPNDSESLIDLMAEDLE